MAAAGWAGARECRGASVQGEVPGAHSGFAGPAEQQAQT